MTGAELAEYVLAHGEWAVLVAVLLLRKDVQHLGKRVDDYDRRLRALETGGRHGMGT